MDAKRLNDVAEDLFKKKGSLNSLLQEVADNFYPERADFTVQRSLGADFAAHLMSSYPVQCRRDLGNDFGSMLRPTANDWFHPTRRHEEKDGEDNEMRGWLEYFEKVQRRVMYDKDSLFTRATKEADHDFAAFGQAVISVEMNKHANGLLYRSWHIRDCAWQENEEGKIGTFVRKWKPSVQTLCRAFRNVHQKVKDICDKSPFEELEVRHFVVEADMYDGNSQGRPRWSVWYDPTNDHVMSELPIWNRHYIVPRWQTVSGSQYSYSPATVCALPDARLLQAMTYTLLEAGEKATNPPVLATQTAVRSDVALYAGGITWLDAEYDEKLGAALRPLEQDFRGFNFGVEMNQDTRLMLMKAFYLDKLSMPVRTAAMTAYEVSQHVQEYIRNALPLFEPMEMEYNAPLCDESFELIWRAGGFGDPRDWPKKLRGAPIDFAFESPLHDAIEEQKGQIFQKGAALIAQAIALDPSCGFVPRAEVALRDALTASGFPANWVNSEGRVEELKQAKQQADAQQAQLANMAQGAAIANDIGQSGLVPQAVPA